ncbi:MAG: ERCC4 domain-containing protein [Candidatus Thermoplasmatota archaeon]|nr:ERCC4 domain-containing protein [Candidatus Thermoplasmatota archaeon]
MAMSTAIHHELLASQTLEARAYQLSAVDHCLSGSTLLVLPTGMGKTPIEVMVLAERLRNYGGRGMMIAPTNGLVNQHLMDLKRLLVLPEGSESIVSLTGSVAPKKRREIWASAKVIVATPQVIRNDVQNGVTNLADVSLLIVDEAHRATGNHAMAQVGDLFAEQNPGGLILAATASPGHIESEINEVCERLKIANIHARPPEDALLKPYASGLEVNDVIVDVPDELRTLATPLEAWMLRIVDRLRRLGYYTRRGHITAGGLQEARNRISVAIGRQEKIAYRAAIDNAIAMRLNNLYSYLLCQGVAATREALSRLDVKGENEGASAKEFAKDSRIIQLRESLNEMQECHSKVTMVRRMVRKQLKENPESRVIIFANFRDTVEEIANVLEDVELAQPQRFVGQASREGSSGMSQKAQVESLNAFKSGDSNVLVATSVGEEGLDVPNADLVIFYEPIGSEIRTIQRRGRTGRQREGTVHVLIARGTRDEGARAAAKRREELMHRSIQQVRRKRGGSPIRAEGANLGAFKLSDGRDASEFLETESIRLAPELSDTVQPEIITNVNSEKITEKQNPKEVADKLRPKGQIGLDSFPSDDNPGRLIINDEENEDVAMIAAESIVQSVQEGISEIADGDIIVKIDHREGQSALAARLRQEGLIVEVASLPVGDIQIGEQILIERKTSRDFVDSLVDGRLLEQASRLVGAAPRSMLILEGSDLFHHRAVHAQAIMGALATLSLDYGLPVVSSSDTAETARFIGVSARREAKMIEHLTQSARRRIQSSPHPDYVTDEEEKQFLKSADEVIDGNSEQLIPVLDATIAPLRDARARDASQITRAMLEQVPGIGPALASRIIERWPTMAALSKATDAEIMDIPGLSVQLAQKIVQLLHGD